MQTIKTKYFGPIAFEKTWVSSDGRHIGKLAKGGYAHLSGSLVTSKNDISDLIPSGKDRKEALEWFVHKDEPQAKSDTRKIMLTPDGGYEWEDGSEITDAVDIYNSIKAGPQLEAVLAWFQEKKTSVADQKKSEQQERMAHARSQIGKKVA